MLSLSATGDFTQMIEPQVIKIFNTKQRHTVTYVMMLPGSRTALYRYNNMHHNMPAECVALRR